MGITPQELERAQVPVAVARYYHRAGGGSKGWGRARSFLRREFPGISSRCLERIIKIAKQGVEAAKQMNRELERIKNGNANA